MFASATPDIGSQPQFAEHRPLSETMRSATPPGDILNRWVLNHRYLSIDGGETLIRLKSKTYIVSDWRSSVISVEGWGLLIPLTNSNQIIRDMGSHILFLLGKAEAVTLNAEQRNSWLHIVTNCDLEDFILHRELAQYFEGKVLRRTPEVRVEWQDGTISTMSPSDARILDILAVGDNFSCYAKLTKSGGIVGLNRLSLLPEMGERITEKWPLK